jgi:hypothetical protein
MNFWRPSWRHIWRLDDPFGDRRDEGVEARLTTFDNYEAFVIFRDAPRPKHLAYWN